MTKESFSWKNAPGFDEAPHIDLLSAY